MNNKISMEKWEDYGIILSENHKRILINKQSDVMIENTKNILNDIIGTVVYDIEKKKWWLNTETLKNGEKHY